MSRLVAMGFCAQYGMFVVTAFGARCAFRRPDGHLRGTSAAAVPPHLLGRVSSLDLRIGGAAAAVDGDRRTGQSRDRVTATFALAGLPPVPCALVFYLAARLWRDDRASSCAMSRSLWSPRYRGGVGPPWRCDSELQHQWTDRSAIRWPHGISARGRAGAARAGSSADRRRVAGTPEPLRPSEYGASHTGRWVGGRGRYIAGGAGEEATMRANWPRLIDGDRAARAAAMCRPLHRDRVVRRHPARAGSCSPGRRRGLVRRRADVLIGQAAAQLGAPTSSNQGSAPMEDAGGGNGSDQAGAPRWFQLYWSADDDLVDSF